MPHSLSDILVHVIFSTKDRKPLITAAIQSDLYAYIGGIIRELGGKSLGINGTQDHVHILLNLPHVLSVADAMRVVKTNSSRWYMRNGPAIQIFPGRQDTQPSA